MKNFIDSIFRTPGVLLMSILTFGFVVNAGVQYINESGTEGGSLLAAGALVIAQILVVIIHQFRKAKQQVKSSEISA
ncbi:MAG: hypothetical protein QE278_01590 [Limnobacter sp.]|nr:hypothetical protein [Limnobacter sp.]